MIRSCFIAFFVCLLSLDSFAQELVVSEMRFGTKEDVYVQEFPKDLNDNECAALIVKTNLIEGIKFEGNIIGVPSYDNGTYTLFVSGAKRVRFKHPDYIAGTIEHSKSFEGARIYIVELTSSAKSKTVDQDGCTLSVTSTPNSLDVYVDGQKMGKTPFSMKDVWAGQYKVEVKNNDGKKYVETVTVNEGETKRVSATFSDMINTVLSFNCHLVNKIVIDGHLYGESVPLEFQPRLLYLPKCIEKWKKSKLSVELSPGAHIIEAEAEGYKNEEKEIVVSSTDKTFSFDLIPEVKSKTITVKGVEMVFRLVQHGYANKMSLFYPDENPVFAEFSYGQYGDRMIFVNSSKDYYIAETELTRKLWFAVMNGETNISNPDKPITNISYYECKQFIAKLNALTGKVFRLPTLTEWQYACQGGIYKDEDKRMHSNSWTKADANNVPHDVAKKYPNTIGLYDMSGNVREICDSWYASEYNVNPQSVIDDFNGVQSGEYVIAKGYSFKSLVEGDSNASSVSSKILPNKGYDDCGFRLVLEMP